MLNCDNLLTFAIPNRIKGIQKRLEYLETVLKNDLNQIRDPSPDYPTPYRASAKLPSFGDKPKPPLGEIELNLCEAGF